MITFTAWRRGNQPPPLAPNQSHHRRGETHNQACLWFNTVSMLLSPPSPPHLRKSCPRMTYSPVRWRRAGSGSSLFIWVLQCCLDKFSTVPSAAAPAHKSFLYVTLISLLPFLKCPRGMSGGGGGDRRWWKKGGELGGRLQHISRRIDWVHLVDWTWTQ